MRLYPSMHTPHSCTPTHTAHTRAQTNGTTAQVRTGNCLQDEARLHSCLQEMQLGRSAEEDSWVGAVVKGKT